MLPRFSSSPGFTLLELLVAISIIATVMAAVYGVFATVSGARDRLERDGEAYQRARVIYDRLGREFRGLCPMGGPSQRGLLRTATDDEGNPLLELTTSATAQQGSQQTGVAVVRYALAPDREQPTGKVLLRSEQSALAGDASDTAGGAMRLAGGISHLEWRFLFADGWRNSLDAERDGLPLLVEVALTMHDARGEALPFRSAFELPAIAWR